VLAGDRGPAWAEGEVIAAMPPSLPESYTGLRRLGRLAASRYPRLTATAIWLGRTLAAMAAVLLFFIILDAVGVVIKKTGWTLEVVGGTILGLLFALYESFASWPWYVWLILIAAFIAHRINSQLEHLTRRIRRLERRVIALTKAIEKEKGESDDFDFDDEDDLRPG